MAFNGITLTQLGSYEKEEIQWYQNMYDLTARLMIDYIKKPLIM